MRTVRDIPVLNGVPVLVRAALNTPMQNGEITSDYRLRRALPTIKFLSERGAKVILASHITGQGTETLEPMARALGKLISNVSFCPVPVGPVAREKVRALSPGSVLVLENLRRDAREKENDPEFASELAGLADVFVQDSFDECHRRYASIVGVPTLLPSYAGLLLEEEVFALGRALSPEHPAIAIIGGAKFATKAPVLKKLVEMYDHVFVGGALANTFLKASGLGVGKSLVSDGDGALEDLRKSSKIFFPSDVRVVSFTDIDVPGAANRARVVSVDAVGPEDVILDAGPQTTSELSKLITEAKTVLWNGPLGNYERGFSSATDEVAHAVAETKGRSIIGGGDTVSAIGELDLMDQFSFVSTGGGAMLDFLAEGTLPGIEVLESGVVA